jgi:hypothetical protein
VQEMLNIMSKSGGDQLVGDLTTLPDDLFYAADVN